jgi:ketosteroid isomerase-like protein
MNANNKAILSEANAFVAKGDYERFLTYCTEDTVWTFLGERILRGKEAVRQYMAEVYVEPPVFEVEHAVAEGDFVAVIGKISLKDKSGKTTDYDYCDSWKFREGKLHELKAFVIKAEQL